MASVLSGHAASVGCRHALWVNRDDVRNLPDAFAARARKRCLEHVGILFGRVHHPLAPR